MILREDEQAFGVVSLTMTSLGEIAQQVYDGTISSPICQKAAFSELPRRVNLASLPLENTDPEKVLMFRDNVFSSVAKEKLDRNGQLVRLLDSEKIDSFQKEGGTLIFVDVNDRHTQIANLVSQLKARIPGRVWVNLFVSAQKDGIGAHWDDNDVFVIQLQGNRKWEFWPPDPILPTAASKQLESEPNSEPVETQILSPGDLMIVPRGWIHKTTLESPFSVHLMFAYRCPTVADMLRKIIDDATSEISLLRENVSMSHSDREQQVRDALSQIDLRSRTDDVAINDLIGNIVEPTASAFFINLENENS